MLKTYIQNTFNSDFLKRYIRKGEAFDLIDNYEIENLAKVFSARNLELVIDSDNKELVIKKDNELLGHIIFNKKKLLVTLINGKDQIFKRDLNDFEVIDNIVKFIKNNKNIHHYFNTNKRDNDFIL